MTENENIKATFEDAIYCAKSWAGDEVCEECRLYPLCYTFCDDVAEIIVKALEEIQQYRAIGTVEELINTQIREKVLNVELESYKEIGTIEDFKALKEDKNFLEFLYNHILPNEMEQYLSMYHTKDKVAVNGYADQSGLMSAT